MTSIHVSVIPYFDDNYSYIVSQDDSENVFVIDCGDSGPVVEYLQKNSFVPKYVLLTHSHYDHAGDIDGLIQEYPGLTVVKPKGEHRIEHEGLEVSDGETLMLENQSLEIHIIPAHTRYCTIFAIDSCLFVGDVLFSAGCGRLFEGDQNDLEKAMDRLKQFSNDVAVYPGHEYTAQNLKFARFIEPHNQTIIQYENEVISLRSEGKGTTPTSIKREKEINPFFRIDESEIVAKLDPEKKLTRAERIGLLRKMKDDF